MRRTVVTTLAVAVMALVGGCTADGDVESANPPPRSDAPAVIDTEACEEVRLGIDAFNVGEFDETIEHFEDAIPLAEEIDDGSTSAGELVEAVHYYAELDAEDYPEAARSSADFLKYKTITLGQCVPETSESPESPGVDI